MFVTFALFVVGLSQKGAANLPFEQVLCWAFALFVLRAAFLFIKDGKLGEAFVILILAMLSFVCGLSAVQGLLKTGVLLKVNESLIGYGKKLDVFQTNIEDARLEINRQQTNIASQYVQISNLQKSLTIAQMDFTKESQANLTLQNQNALYQNNIAKKLEAQLSALQVNVNAVGKAADPSDESLKLLTEKLKDPGIPLSEKIVIADALRQRGHEATSALPLLKQEWETMKFSRIDSAISPYRYALAAAIAQIQGHESLIYFADIARGTNTLFRTRYEALEALKVIPGPWSRTDIGLISTLFVNCDGYSKRIIINWVSRLVPSLLEQPAKEAILQLLIRGIVDPDSTIANDSAATIKGLHMVELETLGPLRNGMESCKDPSAKNVILEVIKEVENSKRAKDHK
jgi:hypothetical protein